MQLTADLFKVRCSDAMCERSAPAEWIGQVDAVDVSPARPLHGERGCCRAQTAPRSRPPRRRLETVAGLTVYSSTRHPPWRAAYTGVYLSGQKGRTVNPLALPSQVRILPRPLVLNRQDLQTHSLRQRHLLSKLKPIQILLIFSKA